MVGEMVDKEMPGDFWPDDGMYIVGAHGEQEHKIPLTQYIYCTLVSGSEMRKDIDKVRTSLWECTRK